MSAEYVMVPAEALTALLNFVIQLPLPMGRDELVKAVVDAAEPVEKVITED